MTSKFLCHYILTFTMLFISSFAAFHGNEHISIGTADLTKDSFAETNNGFQSESEHHLAGEPEPPRTNHNIETLCETCLVLSNLTAYDLNYTDINILPEKTKHRLFNLHHYKRQFFQTYHSRAPPHNA
jgi:hypothetical protein